MKGIYFRKKDVLVGVNERIRAIAFCQWLFDVKKTKSKVEDIVR